MSRTRQEIEVPSQEKKPKTKGSPEEDDTKGWGRVTHNIQVQILTFSFVGTIEPSEWVYKLETTFKHTRVRDELEKIDIAIQHLDGLANSWAARWESKIYTPGTSFNQFKIEFLERTKGINLVPFNVQIANLRQRELTVEEFTKKF